MNRRLPPLSALRAFEATARHLSFTLAAKELLVTQGAVSRQVQHLETFLRVPLFRRRPRALELTPEGEGYYPAIREAFDAMERATSSVLGSSQDRILTLSILPTLAMRWIIPHLAEFNELHPDIEIHMVTSIKPVDFKGEIDMAIRVGMRQTDDPTQPGARIDLVMADDWAGTEAEYLMPDVLIPVCTPELMRGNPPLRTLEDLRRHTLLHNATRPNAWADWLRTVGLTDFPLEIEPRFGHFFMAIQAALQGKGIACVPDILVSDDLATGRLVVPFDQPVESAGAYYMLFRKHRKDIPKLSAFRAWLVAQARLRQKSYRA
jgi:LysR family glycine cleavage system transcriptional activator